jgi:PAS domain S-box-containing protein
MSELLFLQLQEAANKALTSENVEEGMKHLSNAFALFSKEAGRLKNSYDRLRERFDSLNSELEHSNNELRQKNRELNTLNNYLDSLLKKISQGILFIDTEGVVTTFNEEAQKIVGLEENELIFQKFSEVLDDNFFGFSVGKSLKMKLSYPSLIKTIRLKSEEEKHIELSTSYLDKSISPCEGIIIIFKDVTQIQKLQIIANRNERMKELGEMAAVVAHEIRNPLGGIRGFASLLYRDLEETKHLQEMAKYILEGTKTLERLVNNILHYTRPVEAKFETVDICKFIRDLCHFAQADPTLSKEVVMEYHIPEDRIIVSIDQGLFHSALLNIIVNAYQSIEGRGRITLSLLKNNDNCNITVSDTGAGIEAKDLEKIFTPFFTTKKRGNGLGLSEAFRIVQAHGGTIDVRSKTICGTTFTINIPISR